jgi:hypothetical protein
MAMALSSINSVSNTGDVPVGVGTDFGVLVGGAGQNKYGAVHEPTRKTTRRKPTMLIIRGMGIVLSERLEAALTDETVSKSSGIMFADEMC